jgi:hypothetical protein
VRSGQRLACRPLDRLVPRAEYREEALGPLVDRLDDHASTLASDQDLVALEPEALGQPTA